MKREVDVTKIISNLSKIGVKATATKSRLELLKALAPPKSTTQIQNWLGSIQYVWYFLVSSIIFYAWSGTVFR